MNSKKIIHFKFDKNEKNETISDRAQNPIKTDLILVFDLNLSVN